jgi:hypothetical protein
MSVTSSQYDSYCERAEHEMNARPDMGTLLATMRAADWMVGVHNDYRLTGQRMTFWLFTHPDGRWVKGEGKSDAEALMQCVSAAKLD